MASFIKAAGHHRGHPSVITLACCGFPATVRQFVLGTGMCRRHSFYTGWNFRGGIRLLGSVPYSVPGRFKTDLIPHLPASRFYIIDLVSLGFTTRELEEYKRVLLFSSRFHFMMFWGALQHFFRGCHRPGKLCIHPGWFHQLKMISPVEPAFHCFPGHLIGEVVGVGRSSCIYLFAVCIIEPFSRNRGSGKALPEIKDQVQQPRWISSMVFGKITAWHAGDREIAAGRSGIRGNEDCNWWWVQRRWIQGNPIGQAS